MLTRKGVKVPLSQLTKELKKRLTLIPITQAPGLVHVKPKPLHVWLASNDNAYLPRYSPDGQAALQLTSGTTFPTTGTPAPMGPTCAFVGKLRDETGQPQAAAACEESCRKTGGGMLVLPTGFGKTTIALNVACRLGVKTLIIAHKSFLLDQWEERIKQFVPQAQIGRLQRDTVDVDNKDFVLGMLQSIASRDYPPSAFRGIGLVIVDECHHISAPVFSQAMFKCGAKYTIGLSATPDRKDGLGVAVQWFLGHVCVDRRHDIHAEDAVARICRYHCARYDQPLPMMRGGQRVNMAAIVTGLVEDKARNLLIVKELCQAQDAGRKVLVLSERRQHCIDLKDMWSVFNKDKTGSLYLGGMTSAALDEGAKADVLFAPYGLATEGLDVSGLNTLIFATPRSDIVQAVGRILRGAACPLVVDVVDSVSVCYAQHAKRRSYLKKIGFQLVSVGKHVSESEEEEDVGFAFDCDDGEM